MNNLPVACLSRQSERSSYSIRTELSHYVRKLRLSVYSFSSLVILDQRGSLSPPLFSKEDSCWHLGC